MDMDMVTETGAGMDVDIGSDTCMDIGMNMKTKCNAKFSVFLISYEMNIYGKKLYQLYNAIKDCTYDERWVQCLNNVWIIKTELDINTVYEKIKEILENNDCFIIVEVISNCEGWLDDKIWEYLNCEVFGKENGASED